MLGHVEHDGANDRAGQLESKHIGRGRMADETYMIGSRTGTRPKVDALHDVGDEKDSLATPDETSGLRPNSSVNESAKPEAEGDGPPTASTANGDLRRQVTAFSTRLQHSRSYGDGHGYTCYGNDDSCPREAGQDNNPEKEQFEVHWDGEEDPLNPRNMNKARKWTIVLIVSGGATCVYVLSYPVKGR